MEKRKTMILSEKVELSQKRFVNLVIAYDDEWLEFGKIDDMKKVIFLSKSRCQSAHTDVSRHSLENLMNL